MTEKTTLDLDAIEARAKESFIGMAGLCEFVNAARSSDIPALIVEVKRLNDELAQTRALCDHAIDTLERAVRAAYEDAAKIADMYSETNLQQAGDTILLDPCLQGGGFTPENIDTSMDLQIDGCIHSARHSAARDIATAIRARANGGKSP